MKMKTHIPTKEREIRKVLVLSLLLIPLLVPILISCGDFVDEKPPETPPVVQPPVQHPQTPQTPQTPETPKPQTPTETPKETEAQRNWRLCEAERIWAFNARIIDVGALRLYQSRNFAPVFNHPGERQSGVEGWYGCKHALELNGFIPSNVSASYATEPLEASLE